MAAQTTLVLYGVLGAAIALLTVLGALALARPRVLVRDVGDRTVFLLREDVVIDATATARTMLEFMGEGAWSRERLVEWLSNNFPDLPAALETLDQRAERMVIGRDGIGRLDLLNDGDRLRITLSEDGNDRILVDRICQSAARDELETLRRAADGMACPIWVEDRGGHVIWANADYRKRAERLSGAATWPPVALFPAEGYAAATSQRLRLGEDWFDVSAVERDDMRVLTAFPATALAEAEGAMKAFKSTVARTFAHLTVGLAIFDRTGRLAVFNPALGDLTGLPIDLLLAQPPFAAFLDALRTRRMMPEPKNYASWRDRVAAVEGAAQDGTFSELWHLPGERTFRVTGRPQPDGAYALLIEDVTSEVSLTRRFRGEIDAGQAVLDALPDAIAVFDRAGTLTTANAAYDRLWGVGARDAADPVGLDAAVSSWRRKCLPDSAFEDLFEALSCGTGVPGPLAELRLRNDCRVRVFASPLPDGATLLRFADLEGTGRALAPPAFALAVEPPRAQTA